MNPSSKSFYQEKEKHGREQVFPTRKKGHTTSLALRFLEKLQFQIGDYFFLMTKKFINQSKKYKSARIRGQ